MRIDRYELIEKLGEGGMAAVFLARDLLLRRHVALKLLQTHDPGLRQRFITEARITARCRHVNIVVIYEVGEHEGLHFIALEHLRGRSLTRLIEEVGLVPYTRAVEILIPLLRALQCIHGSSIVHRDLKPDNIFMTEQGMPKLLDFGIAKEVPAPGQEHVRAALGSVMDPNALRTQAGALVGTPDYMAPEQCGIGFEVDHRTDIWACGVLLHRLICGRHPLASLDVHPLLYTAGLDLPMPSMRQAAPPEVPGGLIDIVDRCLFKLQDDRWQSADELCTALVPFLDGGLTPAEPVAQPADVRTEIRPRDESAAARPTAIAPPREKHTILCLTSDSTGADGSIRLARQAAGIRRQLEGSRARDHFEVVTQLIAERVDLLRVLRRFKPTVVYFVSSGMEATEYRYGHGLAGDRFGGLFFRGPGGRPQFLSPSAVQETFGVAGASVRLIVMSGCYVDLQAAALLMHVDCVVGTRGTARPEATQTYVSEFMGALGDHESVATAHRQACAAISLEGLSGGDPPEMKVRPGVDAGKLVLAAMP